MSFWKTEIGKKFSHAIHEHNSAIGLIRSWNQFFEKSRGTAFLTEERTVNMIEGIKSQTQKALDAMDYVYKYAQDEFKKEQESTLKTISKKVVSYCEIPEELTAGHWISEHQPGAFIEVHIPDDEQDDGITKWLREKYPELVPESFFIEIDY